MILDGILLITIFVGLHFAKAKYPNFLFYPKGAALFLPPDNPPADANPKKKKQKTEQQVSVLKVQYDHVKDYPFVNQFSRIHITTVGLVIYFPIRYLISFVYHDQSLFTFYTTCLILIYTLKLGIDTFFMTNYGRKNCFLIALSINLVFYLFYAALNTNEGVFDRNLQMVCKDFIKHLQIVFNRQITFFSHKVLMILVFSINFFIIIAAIPTVIKFGNWYTKTLKETSYDQQNPSSLKREGMQERDIKDQQQRLKEQSQKIIYQLNIYLVFMLAVQFFAHRYIHNFLDPHVVFVCQAVCLGICVFIICNTMVSAIEFNGSFGYRYVLQFFQTEDNQKRVELRKKIVAYIYYIWYHYFQFIFRIIVPVLLFLLIINWKYLTTDKHIINGPLATRELNTDIECPLSTDQLSILQNLYKCPNITSTPTSTTKLIQKFFLNGILQSIPRDLQSTAIQNNIQRYGLITRDLMLQFWQQLFWYSSLSIYLMTVFYILFLRKTVYDI